jgi:hypothetical protein
VSPKSCLEKPESRFLLLQCHVSRGYTLTASIKDPLKEEEGLFALPFGALLWAFVLFAWLFALRGGGGGRLFAFEYIGKKLLLWAFWYGKLLEGKRTIKGKNC